MPGAARKRAIDVKAAIRHLDFHAEERSQRWCARYTRQAIEAGGVTLQRAALARDYGPSLEKVGFTPVADEGTYSSYEAQPGDVVIFQAPPGRRAGHMAMYSGSQWVSDFRQRSIYAGQAYRGVPFRVYRP